MSPERQKLLRNIAVPAAVIGALISGCDTDSKPDTRSTVEVTRLTDESLAGPCGTTAIAGYELDQFSTEIQDDPYNPVLPSGLWRSAQLIDVYAGGVDEVYETQENLVSAAEAVRELQKRQERGSLIEPQLTEAKEAIIDAIEAVAAAQSDLDCPAVEILYNEGTYTSRPPRLD